MDILNNIIIVINIKVAEHSSKIPIWVCNFNKNACKWSLEQPYLRLFLYRKLTAISYSADYFQLSEECKHIVDRFYVQEELFADQLEMWPNYLLQMRQVGVFQWKTREIGLQLYHKLRLISHELRTVINIKKKVILNPNSYGLSVRLGNPSSVFDLYSQFVSKAIKDIHFFRNRPTRNAKPEDFEIVVLKANVAIL